MLGRLPARADPPSRPQLQSRRAPPRIRCQDRAASTTTTTPRPPTSTPPSRRWNLSRPTFTSFSAAKTRAATTRVLNDLLRARVKRVYTIGAAAAKIESQIQGAAEIDHAETLENAVQRAADSASPRRHRSPCSSLRQLRPVPELRAPRPGLQRSSALASEARILPGSCRRCRPIGHPERSGPLARTRQLRSHELPILTRLAARTRKLSLTRNSAQYSPCLRVSVVK